MNADSSPHSTTIAATLTSCTINRVQGNQFNNSNNTTNIVHGDYVSCHATEVVKCTDYSEFRKVIRGDVIALQNLYREDLSQYEWQFRGGWGFGRLKATVTTQIIALFPDKDNKFTLVKYEGADAKKVWERDFRTFSELREPGLPQLFAINTSKIPMLIFHHMEFTPVTSTQAENLDFLLWTLSVRFADLVNKRQCSLLVRHRQPQLRVSDDEVFVNSPLPWFAIEYDGMRGPMEQLDSSLESLRPGSSSKKFDQVFQQYLRFLHVWGLEIDSEGGKKDFSKWVKVKDSAIIEELDDDDEDFLNNATSSITKSNSRTRFPQKDEDIGTSTRRNHSNTSQSTRPRTAKPSIKPTQHRQPLKAQQPSPAATAKQVPSRRSDGGTTQSQARNAACQPAVRTSALGVGTTRRVALDATTTTASKAQSTKATGKSKPQWR